MLFSFSKFISYLFHPLFVPLYGLILLFNTGLYINFALNDSAKIIIFLIVIFNTILIPGIFIYFLYRGGYVSTLMAEDRKQRHVLYIMILVFYYCTYLIFKSFSVPIILSSFVFGATISILTLLLVNFFMKISAHMIGVGGVLGMLYGVSDFFLETFSPFFIPILIIAGIIALARIQLNAHRPREIYLGLIIGFCCEYFTLYYEILA